MEFKVTVIIPVFNASLFLKIAVNSALQQEETAEVILVEDGSTDNSLDVCKSLVMSDKRVKLFFHEGNMNKGASASRNLGLAKATSQYIAYLDADDYFLPGRFATTKKIFQEKAADGVYEAIGVDFANDSLKLLYLRSGYKERTTVSVESIKAEKLFETLVLQTHGYFSIDGLTIKADTKHILFDEDLRQMEDTDYFYRLCLTSRLMAGNIQYNVANRRIHGSNQILSTEAVRNQHKIRFYDKWLHILMDNDFDHTVNFRFIKNYLALRINPSSHMMIRKLQLLYHFIFLLAKRPKLLKKLW